MGDLSTTTEAFATHDYKQRIDEQSLFDEDTEIQQKDSEENKVNEIALLPYSDKKIESPQSKERAQVGYGGGIEEISDKHAEFDDSKNEEKTHQSVTEQPSKRK